MFDSDKAGEAAADRAIRVALPRCVKVRLAHVPEGKDPSDYISLAGSEAFSDVLNQAVDALEFKWSQTRSRFVGDGSDASRREAVMDFLGIIAEAHGANAVDAIQRGLLLNQVAHLLQLDRRELDGLMARLQKRSPQHGVAESGSGDVSQRPPPADEEQASWTSLLEVLVNEPGLLGPKTSLPDLCRIADTRDRRIAETTVGLAEQVGEFRMADLLSRCSDPEDAQRLEELARRGAARGNYQNTFDLALERIRRASCNLEIDQSRQRFASATETLKPLGESRDQFKDFVEGMQGHRHFVPRGRRRGSRAIDVEEALPDDLAKLEQP
jgi:hypothetical protein